MNHHKNLKSNMTSENREIFLNDIGSSPEGRSFRDYLEKCQVIDDEEGQKGEEEEWTYTITPGQLKNYADKFCVSRDDLFGLDPGGGSSSLCPSTCREA